MKEGKSERISWGYHLLIDYIDLHSLASCYCEHKIKKPAAEEEMITKQQPRYSSKMAAEGNLISNHIILSPKKLQ